MSAYAVEVADKTESLDFEIEKLPPQMTVHLRNRAEHDPRAVHNVLAGVRAGLSLNISLHQNGIAWMTWHQWQDKWPELRELLLKAQELGSHALAQQCLDIADQVEDDREAIAKAKLRIDTRKDLIKHWNRAYYGDQIAQVASHTFTINTDAPNLPNPDDD